MRWAAVLTLLLAPIAGAQTDPLEEVDFEQRLGSALPLDAPFFDSNGDEVRLGDLFGERPVIFLLVYYQCPMLCNEVLNGLVRSLRALKLDAGEGYEVVAVSIDPTETPDLAAAKLERYLVTYGREGTDDGWHFLTGGQEAIDRAADAVGFRYVYDPETRQYAHAAGIVVATPEGRVSRYFYGVEFATRDLRLGLVEASGGKIGSAVDRVLLYCFHYDPTTGKYGLAIMNVLRAGGIATLGVLGVFVLGSLRRERRRANQAAAGSR